jgi:transcriptional regulator with GAF, ATPase, and Fis domain
MSAAGVRGLATALAALVADDLDVADVLAHLVADCADATGADAVAILARDGGTPVALLTATSHRAVEIEMLQAQHLSGPCIDAIAEHRQVSATGTDELVRRWPTIGTAMAEAGFDSVHAFPMSWRGETFGGLNLFRSGPIEADASPIAQAYADVATLAIVQTVAVSHDQVHARLREALEAREIVEQAKGVLAYTEDIDLEQAYRRLVDLGSSEHGSLTQVARAVVDHRGAPPAAATGD